MYMYIYAGVKRGRKKLMFVYVERERMIVLFSKKKND